MRLIPLRKKTGITAAAVLAAASVSALCFLLINHRYEDGISALCSSILFVMITELDEINNVKPSSYIVSGESSLCFAVLVFFMFLDIDVPLLVPAVIFSVIYLAFKSFMNGNKAFNGLIITLVTAVLSVTAYCKFDMESPLMFAGGFSEFSAVSAAVSGALFGAVLVFRRRGQHCCSGLHGSPVSALFTAFILSVVRSISVFMLFTVNGFAALPAVMPENSVFRRVMTFLSAFVFFSALAFAASAGILYWYCGISILISIIVYGIEKRRKAADALCKRTFIYEERKNNS